MIAGSNVPPRPSRRIVLLTKIKTTAAGLGSRTLSFFRKGEELEATEYKSLPYDDPMLVTPKLGFRSFDRVPRNRTPLVLAVVLIAATALSVFGWRAVRKLPRETANVAASVHGKASGEWGRLKTFVGSGQSAPEAQK
jgi:hypothetical protein